VKSYVITLQSLLVNVIFQVDFGELFYLIIDSLKMFVVIKQLIYRTKIFFD